jgi:hypothetical protein
MRKGYQKLPVFGLQEENLRLWRPIDNSAGFPAYYAV